ncbi:MAG: hypothetical protein HQ519_01290, partial [Planctomycetes bacterium]|nr:hypothetical protein [Planctomycetota bacterium]
TLLSLSTSGYTQETAAEPTEAKTADVAEASSQSTSNFSGLWTTTYGRMRLEIDSKNATGTYAYGNVSRIEGEIADDGTLHFQYFEPETRGEGWFQLAEDGTGFHGRWRADGTEGWQIWTGRRVDPVKNRTWLVVLEAHWETGLAENEFSFGDMLRSYFKMSEAQHIAVRHRFFHDDDDLRRFCREVTFLAEPVVLLISTHGSQAGIQVGGKTVTPQEFAPALKHAHNVKLLHLSGCDMMAGDVPLQIQKILEGHAQFPISGYKQTVAWDASALGDFTFLSMMFMHRKSPMDAAKHAIKLSPFMGDSVPKGSVFRPLGLTVVPPPASPES